ncbi:hypothetical protein [Actinomadura sp. NPDC048394]|uniref:hypothetical protein n=1 Tax=Actinomadura sp. NPDC048394 TaxID=3158223 RepID=UPI0033E5C4DE
MDTTPTTAYGPEPHSLLDHLELLGEALQRVVITDRARHPNAYRQISDELIVAVRNTLGAAEPILGARDVLAAALRDTAARQRAARHCPHTGTAPCCHHAHRVSTSPLDIATRALVGDDSA